MHLPGGHSKTLAVQVLMLLCLYLAEPVSLPKELRLCSQSVLCPPAAGTSSSRPRSLQRQIFTNQHQPTHGLWQQEALVQTSTGQAGSWFQGLSWPMTSKKRSDSLNWGWGVFLLVPLLSILFQPRGNNRAFLSASSGHLPSAFTLLVIIFYYSCCGGKKKATYLNLHGGPYKLRDQE